METVAVRWYRSFRGYERTIVEVEVPNGADREAFIAAYMEDLQDDGLQWEEYESEVDDYSHDILGVVAHNGQIIPTA